MPHHASAGRPFDRQHEFGRNPAIAVDPVPDMLLLATAGASQRRLPAYNPNRPLQMYFMHSHIVYIYSTKCKNVVRLTV